jgi:hypothetical protein
MKLNFGKIKSFKPKAAVRANKLYVGSSDGSKPDWLITDPDEQRRAAMEQKAFRGGGNRAPELWLRDGDEKLVRFRHPSKLAVIWRYSLKLKNGKFMQVTQPAKGKVDLFASELGLKPSYKAIYEVIDIKGYKDRKGARKTNQPKFYLASHKQAENLNKIEEKRGGLHKMDIEISRAGSGTQTTYSFYAQDNEPMTEEQRNAPKLAGRIAEFFAPPKESEQRALVAQAVSNRDRDED